MRYTVFIDLRRHKEDAAGERGQQVGTLKLEFVEFEDLARGIAALLEHARVNRSPENNK